MANRWGKSEWQILFSWAPESLWTVTAAMKFKSICSLEGELWETYKSYLKTDITLPKKVHIFKVIIYPVVTYECESWTIKKTEHWRIDAFKLWCWRSHWRFPWTAKRSNQSILKEISLDYSLEGLKLKLQYFGYLMRRADPLEKTLMLEKMESKRRRRWQKMTWLDSITNSMDMNVSKFQETVEDGGAYYWHATVFGIAKSRTWQRLSNNGTINCELFLTEPTPTDGPINSY